MLPANKPENLRRRVNRARRGTGVGVTCPASRHVHIMAEALLKPRGYPMLAEEPEHCAGSMLSVLESLWKARAQLAKFRGGWSRPRWGVHSCGFHCDRPDCIKTQRDALVKQFVRG